MKKFTSILLTVIMILALLPLNRVVFAQDETEETDATLESAKQELQAEIDKAKKAKENVVVATDPNEVEKGKKYVENQDSITALENAIAQAETALEGGSANNDSLTSAKTTLTEAISTFKSVLKFGTKEQPSKPETIPDYSRRVPSAVRTTVENANKFQNCPGYLVARRDLKYRFENSLNNLKAIADRFENGYYGRYYHDYYDRYDRYYDRIYYKNGVPYTYYEFFDRFGYYPDRYFRYGYDYDYYDRYGDWDPYYGYQNRYGYNGYGLREAVEKVIDNIREIAYEVGPAFSCTFSYRNLAYPTYASYEGYYDYGYNYDNPRINELKKLIGEAEELANSRDDEAWMSFRSDLVDAANYGRRAVQGRASVRDAISELEKTIKKAKTEGMKVYIRRAYMKGVDANHFAPNGALTRAEMAQILANLLEQSGNKVAYNPKNFKDVSASAWYKNAVDLASTYNIMIGNPDGTFKPQENVSIEELIVMAARIGGHTPRTGNVFGIVNHKWSVPYIQTAYVNKWIGLERFNPSDAISRGKATQILNRAMNYGVDKEFISKNGARMNRFADLNSSSPYYYDILSATNTISYQQAPNSKMRYWRAFIDNGNWTDNKFSKGTYVEPYTGW